MEPDLVALVVALVGVLVYIFLCIPVAKWVARRLTGQPFHFRLRPEQGSPEGQWRDVAWSAGTLVVTMALLGAIIEVLGLGP